MRKDYLTGSALKEATMTPRQWKRREKWINLGTGISFILLLILLTLIAMVLQ